MFEFVFLNCLLSFRLFSGVVQSRTSVVVRATGGGVLKQGAGVDSCVGFIVAGVYDETKATMKILK